MTFYHFGRAVCAAVLPLLFKMRFIGIENIPTDRGYILCSNHRTYMDPLFIGIKLRKQTLTFMAKQELFEKPVLGPIIRGLGAFPVSRSKGDVTAVNTAIKTVREGKILALFPEGGRARTNVPLKPKSGVALIASQTGADVVPACVYFEGKLHFRSRVTIRYGKVVTHEELGMHEGFSPREIRDASRLLMDRIIALLEEKH